MVRVVLNAVSGERKLDGMDFVAYLWPRLLIKSYVPDMSLYKILGCSLFCTVSSSVRLENALCLSAHDCEMSQIHSRFWSPRKNKACWLCTYLQTWASRWKLYPELHRSRKRNRQREVDDFTVNSFRNTALLINKANCDLLFDTRFVEHVIVSFVPLPALGHYLWHVQDLTPLFS